MQVVDESAMHAHRGKRSDGAARIRRAAEFGAWFVAIFGMAVLVVGWWGGVESLTRPLPVGDSMKANTALGFALLGLALATRLPEPPSSRWVRLGRICAVVVVCLALGTLFEDATGITLGIDELLAEDAHGNPPGRPAPNTALAFFCFGVAVLVMDSNWRIATVATMAPLVVSLIALSGYVTGVHELYGLGDLTGMATTTATLSLVFALSVFAARPNREPIQRLSWPDSGGMVARIMIPLFAVLFIGSTWLMQQLTGSENGELPPEAVLSSNVMLSAAVVGVAWYLAGKLHRSDEERVSAIEQRLRDKDELIASVAHELRNPVTAILGLTSMLEEIDAGEYPGTDPVALRRAIASQGSELSALIEDLLVASRGDIGALSVTREPVRLIEQVENTLGGLRAGSLDGVNVDVSSDVVVLADPLRVRQILRNLFTNAARYGGDTVRVVFSDHGSHASVSVLDDGAGPRGDIEKLFDAYQTLHGQSGRPGSVGLGLAVSQALAQRMGGRITFDRRDGWTVFQLHLPTVDDPILVPAG